MKEYFVERPHVVSKIVASSKEEAKQEYKRVTGMKRLVAKVWDANDYIGMYERDNPGAYAIRIEALKRLEPLNVAIDNAPKFCDINDVIEEHKLGC